MSKAYLLRASQYLRFDLASDQADGGYPRALTDGWSGLSGTGFESEIDAALDLGTGKVYLLKGGYYVRIDQQRNAVDAPVRSISEGWAGLDALGFATGIDAAVNWGNGKAYLFKGNAYVRYDIATDRADDGYPWTIADGWYGLDAAGFATDIDAAVNWGNGKAYLFKGDAYVRYDIATDRMDDGYPLRIADRWAGLENGGFSDGIDAIWVKLTASASPQVAGRLGLP